MVYYGNTADLTAFYSLISPFPDRGRTILQTIEAFIDEHGNVQLLETVPLPPGQRRRVLITILDEPPVLDEVTLLSEAALAEDWNRPEEDAAWSYLQQDQ